MSIERRGKVRYGNAQADIREKVVRYAKLNGYPAHHFADATCACGGQTFRLSLDDKEGAAVRKCAQCAAVRAVGDSDEYLDAASLEECACPCGGEALELTAAVSLHDGSEDVLWFYVGCRCPSCGLVAVYGDWKNEFNGYRDLLSRV